MYEDFIIPSPYVDYWGLNYGEEKGTDDNLCNKKNDLCESSVLQRSVPPETRINAFAYFIRVYTAVLKLE